MDDLVKEGLDWLKRWGQKTWADEQMREAEGIILKLCIPQLTEQLSINRGKIDRGLIMGALAARQVGDCCCDLMPPGKLCMVCLQKMVDIHEAQGG